MIEYRWNEFTAYESEGDFGEADADEFGYEYEDENACDSGNEMEGDYGELESGEYGYEFEGDYEYEGDYESSGGSSYETEMYAESPFSEAEEMALASELLSSQTKLSSRNSSRPLEKGGWRCREVFVVRSRQTARRDL